MNLNELVKHQGGHQCAEQKAYVMKLWHNAKGRHEREHPEGKSIPRQRRFWLQTLDTTRRWWEQATGVSISGSLQEATPGLQLLEALQGPSHGRTAAATFPQPAGDEEGPAKKKAHADEPIDRAQLMAEI